MKNTDVFSAEYDVSVYADGYSGEELAGKMNEFLSADTIEIHKRSKKKGEVIVDIKPSVDIMSMKPDVKMLNMHMKLPAGNAFNLNVNAVLDAFSDKMCISLSIYCIKRTKISAEDGSDFV